MSLWFERYGHGEVADGLLTGALPGDGDDVAVLARAGVTRVLNLVQDGEYEEGMRGEVVAALHEADIEEQRIELVDFGGLLPGQLEHGTRLVAAWLEAGERVYLHCRAGWQRSATVIAAVLTLRENLAPWKALEALRERKPTANPLSHQREDLFDWWELREK